MEALIHRYNLGRLQAEFYCVVSKQKLYSPKYLVCPKSDGISLQVSSFGCVPVGESAEQESYCEVNKNTKIRISFCLFSVPPLAFSQVISRQNKGSVDKLLIQNILVYPSHKFFCLKIHHPRPRHCTGNIFTV